MQGGLPTAAESIARSQVPEGVRPAAGLTPEQETDRRIGLQVRTEANKKRQEGRDPVEALRRLGEPTNIDVDAELGRRIGTDITPRVDAAGATTPEGAIFNAAKTPAELMQRLGNEGYDNITDAAERTQLQNIFITEILDHRPAYAALDPLEKQAVAEEMLRDDRYQEIIRNGLAELIGPGEFDLADALVTARRDVDVNEANIATNRSNRLNAAAEKRKFEDNSATAGSRGAELDRLETLEASEATNTTEITDRVDQLHGLGVTDDQLDALRISTEAKIAAGDPLTPQETLMGEMITYKNDIDELDGLRVQRDNADAELARLRGERDILVARRTDLESVYSNTRDAKADQETQLLNDLLDLEKTAGDLYIDDVVIPKGLEAFNAVVALDLKNQKDADERRVLDAIQRRYNTTRIDWRGRTIPIIDKANASTDFETIVRRGPTGGPELVAHRFLFADLPDPASARFASLPQAEQTRVVAERDRVQNRWDTDAEFKRRVVRETATQVILHNAQSGRMHPGDLRQIIQYNPEWGQDAVTNAIEKQKEYNASVRDAVKEFGGAGSLLAQLRRTHAGLGLLALLLAGYTVAGGFARSQSYSVEGIRNLAA